MLADNISDARVSKRGHGRCGSCASMAAILETRAHGGGSRVDVPRRSRGGLSGTAVVIGVLAVIVAIRGSGYWRSLAGR